MPDPPVDKLQPCQTHPSTKYSLGQMCLLVPHKHARTQIGPAQSMDSDRSGKTQTHHTDSDRSGKSQTHQMISKQAT